MAPRPKLRELCYEAFSILHSGETKTPVYVAQRLNRRSIEDADESGPRSFLQMRACRVLSELSWRITSARAIPEDTWRLPVTCPRQPQWRRVSV